MSCSTRGLNLWELWIFLPWHVVLRAYLSPNVCFLIFLMSNNNIISKWRYHRHKNVASLAGHMSALTPMGAPRFATHDETDKYCAAHCLTIYM
eukprot:SAG11_NODE_1831_length_4191_cov_4.013930_2_plen_93_part_00